MNEPELEKNPGFLDRMRDFAGNAADRLSNIPKSKIAVYGSATVVAFGATMESTINPPTAHAELKYLPSDAPVPERCPLAESQYPTKPCDMGVDPSAFDNGEVAICQMDAIGNTTDPKNSGMIISRDIGYKLGSKKVVVNEKLSRLESWSVFSYYYSCSAVTDNKVSQRMVMAKVSKKRPRTTSYKSLTKPKIAKGSETTAFDASHFGEGRTIARTTVFKLPRKLTRQDVKKRRICLEDTITSEPLIQKPYVDPYGRPEYSVPGPMTTQARTFVNCVRWPQVSKPAKSRKK